MNIRSVTSPGGITAWLVKEHSVPTLSLRFAFEGGAAQDPAGKEGVATFLANMLLEGAGDFSATAFRERGQDLALRIGFTAGKDGFSGSFDVLTESRAEAIPLLRLALCEPRFDAAAIERTRQKLGVGIARALREPDKVAGQQWEAVAFAGHPYASTVTAGSIAAITAGDLEIYRQRIFARESLTVVAVGDITPAELGALLDCVFADLPLRPDLRPIPHIATLPAGRQAVVEMEVPQSVAVFGMRAVARKDPDYMAAVIVNHIVGGGGFSSRLMEEVRVKRGLAYGVSTALSSLRHAAVLRGSVATRNDLVGRSIDIIRTELQKVANGEIGAHDLETAKNYLIGSYPLGFDSNTKIAGQLLGLRIDGLEPDHIENRNGQLAAVTLDDARCIASRIFDPKNLIVTVVGKPSLRSALAAPEVAASAA